MHIIGVKKLTGNFIDRLMQQRLNSLFYFTVTGTAANVGLKPFFDNTFISVWWAQGNQCKAKEIFVAADSWAAQAPDYIDAPKHSQIPQMHANTCMETCCKTFVDKQDSNKIKVDEVTKNL